MYDVIMRDCKDWAVNVTQKTLEIPHTHGFPRFLRTLIQNPSINLQKTLISEQHKVKGAKGPFFAKVRSNAAETQKKEQH